MSRDQSEAVIIYKILLLSDTKYNGIDAIFEEKQQRLELTQSGSSVSIVLVFYIFLQIHSIFMAIRGEKLITIAVSLL